MPSIPFALQWPIQADRLLPLKDSINGCLFSDTVSNIPEFEYYLEINPNGDSDEHRGQTLIFFCVQLKNVKKVECIRTFTIESANFSRKTQKVYDKSTGWGVNICDTKDLFDPEKKFIVDGKFIVKVNGTFKFETAEGSLATIDGEQQKWRGGELGNELWENNATKDFTIITNDGKEIHAHKFILGIRSEVFAAMFNSNMKEAAENKMVIPDFPFKIVETGLKIIYDCNFVTALTMNELILFLQFFDKYQLPTLKAKIEPLLIDQIYAATVCNLTNASVLTNSFKLKEKCMEFLSAAFESKTPLHDIDDLDKDIIVEIVKNSFYQTVGTK